MLGALSYGASLLLDMYALRLLGAAREAAYFATAPFIGALLALPVLAKRPAPSSWRPAPCMAAGVVLLARERHGHLHTHEAIEHEHLHVHDEHHQHDHAVGIARHHHDHHFTENPHLPMLLPHGIKTPMVAGFGTYRRKN